MLNQSSSALSNLVQALVLEIYFQRQSATHNNTRHDGVNLAVSQTLFANIYDSSFPQSIYHNGRGWIDGCAGTLSVLEMECC